MLCRQAWLKDTTQGQKESNPRPIKLKSTTLITRPQGFKNLLRDITPCIITPGDLILEILRNPLSRQKVLQFHGQIEAQRVKKI